MNAVNLPSQVLNGQPSNQKKLIEANEKQIIETITPNASLLLQKPQLRLTPPEISTCIDGLEKVSKMSEQEIGQTFTDVNQIDNLCKLKKLADQEPPARFRVSEMKYVSATNKNDDMTRVIGSIYYGNLNGECGRIRLPHNTGMKVSEADKFTQSGGSVKHLQVNQTNLAQSLALDDFLEAKEYLEEGQENGISARRVLKREKALRDSLDVLINVCQNLLIQSVDATHW